MRVLMSAVGTRGDIQPLFALALCAREHGHEVSLCIPPNFIDSANTLGLEATSVGIEMRGSRPGEAPKPIPDLITDQFDTLHRAAKRCDVIVGANAHQYAAPSIAELLGVPYVNALYAPTALPSEENVVAWNNRACDRVNTNRTRFGLRPIDDVLRHIVTDEPWLATDAVLSPAPGPPGLRITQTGAWMLHDPRPLPRDLEVFLESGDPPVYFGFGSMPVAQGTNGVLIAAACAAGRRAIVSRGWGELSLVDNAPDCIEIDDVNHSALFERVATVVHHGGAGTTHAAARAGAPQVILPMFGDQPYWASRIGALGIGTSVPPAEISATRLASAIASVVQSETVERAHVLAPRIASDGVDVAVTLLSNVTM